MRTGPSTRDLVEQIMALDESAARCPPGSDLDRRMIRLRSWAAVFLGNLGDSTAQAIVIGERLVADQRTRPGPGPPRHPGLAQQPRRRLPGCGPPR